MLDEEISEDLDQGEELENDDDAEEVEIPSILVPIFNKEKDILGYARIDKEDEYKLKGLSLIQAVGPTGYTAVLVTPFQQKTLPLSHFLTGIPPKGLSKDHINRNSSFYSISRKYCSIYILDILQYLVKMLSLILIDSYILDICEYGPICNTLQ
jgi:hypothetical protein